jgi:GNAT superfamily N-acetyltransferase
LVASGILSHAIALYAHDDAARRSFFDSGFGGRTIDAVRELTPLATEPPNGLIIRLAAEDDAEMLAALSGALATHLRQPPMFMPVEGASAAEIARSIADGRWCYAAALHGPKAVAYLRWEASGETFASEHPSMMNITGAYTLPESRGTGISAALLAWLMDHPRGQGYERCGVDLETFNAPARRFWSRYFTPYTVGVVRRIDERILGEPGV